MLRDRRFVILAAAALATAAIWANALLSARPQLELTILDVGEGLCAVVRTPSGKTLVVDCGTSSWRDDESVGRKLVAPYLQSLGVDIIDVAVHTHPHADLDTEAYPHADADAHADRHADDHQDADIHAHPDADQDADTDPHAQPEDGGKNR